LEPFFSSSSQRPPPTPCPHPQRPDAASLLPAPRSDPPSLCVAAVGRLFPRMRSCAHQLLAGRVIAPSAAAPAGFVRPRASGAGPHPHRLCAPLGSGARRGSPFEKTASPRWRRCERTRARRTHPSRPSLGASESRSMPAPSGPVPTPPLSRPRTGGSAKSRTGAEEVGECGSVGRTVVGSARVTSRGDPTSGRARPCQRCVRHGATPRRRRSPSGRNQALGRKDASQKGTNARSVRDGFEVGREEAPVRVPPGGAVCGC
jgi:hypothetical protein